MASRDRHLDAVVGPCRSDQARGAAAEDEAEIGGFGGGALLLGHGLDGDAGDGGGGDRVHIQAFFVSASELGIATDPCGRAQLHLAIVGADQDVAGSGDDDAAGGRVVGKLLDIRAMRRPPAALRGSDFEVRVKASGHRADQFAQRRAEGLQQLVGFLDAQKRRDSRQVSHLFELRGLGGEDSGLGARPV